MELIKTTWSSYDTLEVVVIAAGRLLPIQKTSIIQATIIVVNICNQYDLDTLFVYYLLRDQITFLPISIFISLNSIKKSVNAAFPISY